eukprot:3080986-Pleurochrysis_carterae.AAC.1
MRYAGDYTMCELLNPPLNLQVERSSYTRCVPPSMHVGGRDALLLIVREANKNAQVVRHTALTG